MKKIYLDKKEFRYSNIEDLKEELEKRNISIGEGSTVGEGTFLGTNIAIGKNVSIGNYCCVGNHTVLKTDVKIYNRSSVGNHCLIYTGASIGYRSFVGNYVNILPNAQVKNRCTIGNNSTVGSSSVIGSNTFTRNNTSIGNNVVIGNDVALNYGVSIRDQAYICNGSTIGDYSSVKEKIKLHKNIYIVGSLGPASAITYVGNNMVSVGCRLFTLDELTRALPEICRAEGMTEDQIKEYNEYLSIVKKFSKL